MERDFKEEQRYIKAKKEVEKIKGFYAHIGVSVIIIPFLIFINLKTVPDFHWFWFPILGLSISIIIHWLSVFGSNFFLGKNWEERKIEELMNKKK